MRSFSSLNEILDEAAAGRELRRYLELRGVRTIGTMALVAADENAFQKSLIDPLLAGFGTGTEKVSVPEEEKPIARAVLLHAWSLAKTTWSRSMAPPLPSGTAVAPTVAAPSTTGSTVDHKVPKCMPPGKWSELGERLQQCDFERQAQVLSCEGATWSGASGDPSLA